MMLPNSQAGNCSSFTDFLSFGIDFLSTSSLVKEEVKKEVNGAWYES